MQIRSKVQSITEMAMQIGGGFLVPFRLFYLYNLPTWVMNKPAKTGKGGGKGHCIGEKNDNGKKILNQNVKATEKYFDKPRTSAD